MFAALGNNFSKIFDKLKGKGYISESDISEAMREIRIALLEADVALPVIKDLISIIKEKALGAEVIKSISPGQMVVKIVHDELVKILGSENQILNLNAAAPVVIMMVGLQGSGKTTSTAKLALRLRQKSKKKILLASLDLARPAAREQLETLSKEINVDSLPIDKNDMSVEDVTKRALTSARSYDILILDTAGRLHTDEGLMEELILIKKIVRPTEILLVVDALIGQDAVNIGREFHEKLELTGIILTKIDGDSRGGAAISLRHVTSVPIKFIGVGEKANELEEFHPERAASRIFGKGDVVSLVENAAQHIDEKDAEKMAAKLHKGSFDMNDLLSQFRLLKKIGGFGSVMAMIPGLGKIKNAMQNSNIDDSIIKKHEAIIKSMTLAERKNPDLLNASRKIRIAKGSGTKVEHVNKLLKQFLEMQNMVKKFRGFGANDMNKIEKMINGKK